MNGFNENNMNEFAPPSKKNLKIVVIILVMLIIYQKIDLSVFLVKLLLL